MSKALAPAAGVIRATSGWAILILFPAYTTQLFYCGLLCSPEAWRTFVFRLHYLLYVQQSSDSFDPVYQFVRSPEDRFQH
jgi:hypothetical protein